MNRRVVFTGALLLCTASTASGQQTERVRVNEDGDLVAEGARDSSGHPVRIVITRRVHVRPAVVCKIRQVVDSFLYEYRVENGSEAVQQIQVFWIEAPVRVSSSRGPAHWRTHIDRGRTAQDRVYFFQLDQSGRLKPGAAAEGFFVQSNARPGLVRIHFVGHKPLPGEPGYSGDEAAVDSPDLQISAWLREEIQRQLSMEFNSMRVYAIGPKSPSSLPADRALREELREALGIPDFQPDRESIQALLDAADRPALRTGLQRLAEDASGLRRDLYEALLAYR